MVWVLPDRPKMSGEGTSNMMCTGGTSDVVEFPDGEGSFSIQVTGVAENRMRIERRTSWERSWELYELSKSVLVDSSGKDRRNGFPSKGK